MWAFFSSNVLCNLSPRPLHSLGGTNKTSSTYGPDSETSFTLPSCTLKGLSYWKNNIQKVICLSDYYDPWLHFVTRRHLVVQWWVWGADWRRDMQPVKTSKHIPTLVSFSAEGNESNSSDMTWMISIRYELFFLLSFQKCKHKWGQLVLYMYSSLCLHLLLTAVTAAIVCNAELMLISTSFSNILNSDTVTIRVGYSTQYEYGTGSDVNGSNQTE